MAHDKVYGICENKCMVEVFPKSETYSKTTIETELNKKLNSRILSGNVKASNYIFRKTNFNVGELCFLNLLLDDDGDYSSHSVSIEKRFECEYNITTSYSDYGDGQVKAGYFNDTDDQKSIYTDSSSRGEIHITGWIIRLS